MWQSVANFADSELKANAEVAKITYERLQLATLELQKHVKELLSDYPGAKTEELGKLADPEPNGSPGEPLAHASLLLSSLCAQPAGGDVTNAPGAIYTPKGDARQRTPMDAGVPVLEGSDALRVFLSADVPSVRWEAAGPCLGSGPCPQDGRYRYPGGVLVGPPCGAPRQRPVGHSRLPLPLPLPLHLRVDATAATGGDMYGELQKHRTDELRSWALSVLRELHADVTLEDVHGKLLRGAVQYGTLPSREGAWFNVYGDSNNDDVAVRSRELLAALFHSSASSREAWGAVTEAFAHGQAQPNGETARLLGAACSSSEGSLSHISDVTPATWQSHVRDLLEKMDRLAGELLQRGMADGSSPRAGGSLSEKDLAVYRLAITPRSYLQVVGQGLLYHAARQIPCMAELPERIPDWTLRALYGKPFAEAVKLALQHGLAAVDDAFRPEGAEGRPEQRVRGAKLARSLLRPSAGRKNDSKQQQHQPRYTRLDAAAATARFSGTDAVAAAADSSGKREAAGGHCPSGCTGGRGKADACQRALGRARSAVELLVDVELDVRGFEAGFAAIVQSFCRLEDRPWRPVAESSSSCSSCKQQQQFGSPLPFSTGQQQQALPLQQQQPLQLQQEPQQPRPQPSGSAHVAAGYLAVVREEVARAVRELGPTLRAFLYGSVTSAAQVCLAGGNDPILHNPPGTIPLCAAIWPLPVLEDVVRQQPSKLRTVQGKDTRQGSTTALPRSGSCSSSSSTCLGSHSRSSSSSCSPPPRGGHCHVGDALHRGSSVCASPQRSCTQAAARGYTCTHDRDAPPLIDTISHGLLEFVAWLLDRLQQLPKPLQAVLTSAVLECLGQLMDRLSLRTATATDPRDPLPLPAAFLLHAAACCVRRRLQAMQPLELLAASDPLMGPHRRRGCSAHREQEGALEAVQQYGEALVQTDELVSSIQQHIVLSCMQVMYDVVLASLDRTNWCAFRPEVARGQSAGPTPRVWHSMMWRLLRTAAAHASPCAAELVFGQVLLESAACLVQRYLQLGPTVQMLREFVADAVHLTASLVLFCQPIPVRQTLQLPRAGVGCVGGGASWAGHGFGWEPHPQDSATDGAKAHGLQMHWLRVPFPMARALAGAARELLTRAALLQLPGEQLAQLAGRAGCLQSSGTAAEAEVPAGPDASAAAAAAVPSLDQRTLAGGSAAAAAAAAGLADPWVANSPSASGAGGLLQGSGTNEERLGLWTSWLPSDVVCALTEPAQAIVVGGGEGSGAGGLAVSQMLIPLDDRMAETATAGEGDEQGLKEAEGSMWRSCLQHLAQRATVEQVVLAVARRQELHAAVGTEPPGNSESRRAVRGLARRLGLIPENVGDG